MKNRKTVIVAFMLVAVMLLGVGYAAIESELVINGTATFDKAAAEEAFKTEILFTTTAMTGSTGSATGTPEAPVQDTASGRNTATGTFTVKTLMNVGEKANYHFEVTNNSEVDVEITLPTELTKTSTGTGANYYTVTIRYEKDGVPVVDSATVAPKGTLDMYVVVELTTPPVDAVEASYEIKFPVMAVEA